MKQRPKPAPHHRLTDLEARYGEIGISAVAAALRYKTDARNPAYAPVAPDPDRHTNFAEYEA